jgi:hypothetical protein
MFGAGLAAPALVTAFAIVVLAQAPQPPRPTLGPGVEMGQ